MNQYLRLAQQRVSLLRQFSFIMAGLCITVPSAYSMCAATVDSHDRIEEIISEWLVRGIASDQRDQLRIELQAISKSSPSAEVRAGALYFLGRVGDPLMTGDLPEFRRLIAELPEQPLAQLARLKLIIHHLYSLDGIDIKERLVEAEKMGGEITQPELLSDFHLIMGDAYLFFGDQRKPALRHFIAAEHLGISSSATRATVLVQIGELSRLTGDTLKAKESYQNFLRDFPRDIRQQIVRDHLATLRGETE